MEGSAIDGKTNFFERIVGDYAGTNAQGCSRENGGYDK